MYPIRVLSFGERDIAGGFDTYVSVSGDKYLLPFIREPDILLPKHPTAVGMSREDTHKRPSYFFTLYEVQIERVADIGNG